MAGSLLDCHQVISPIYVWTNDQKVKQQLSFSTLDISTLSSDDITRSVLTSCRLRGDLVSFLSTGFHSNNTWWREWSVSLFHIHKQQLSQWQKIRRPGSPDEPFWFEVRAVWLSSRWLLSLKAVLNWWPESGRSSGKHLCQRAHHGEMKWNIHWFETFHLDSFTVQYF